LSPFFIEMINGFLAKKVKMDQYYDQEGNLVPVTVLRAWPCLITQKEKDSDRFSVQIGAGNRKNITKPQKGHLKKSGVEKPLFLLRQVRAESQKGLKVGQKIKPSEVFSPGDEVSAQGVSKGRGFSGVIKRWGFSSQPKTHGQSDRERAPGSIGAQTPGRVVKGKKMPGHYGSQKVTIKNLVILRVDEENNTIMIKGSVPGSIKNWLLINKTGRKAKRFVPLADKKAKVKDKEVKNTRSKKTKKVVRKAEKKDDQNE